MIPHIQKDLGENTGDCFAACLASILEIPLEDVPNFRRLQEENEKYDMVMEADKWLRANHGKRFITIDLYKPAGGPQTDQVILNRLFYSNENDLLILSGVSPRPAPDGSNRYHCVVAKADCWGYELIHDPHPEGGGIIGQPFGVKWIVPV